MKTALCLSGRWNQHCNPKWIERTKQHVPHDKVYTGTWSNQIYGLYGEVNMKQVGFSPDFYFDEPKNEYHPVFDTEAYPDSASELRRDIFPHMLEREKISKMRYAVGLDDTIYTNSQLVHAHACANWHKQLLIHNEMMKSIPDEYDMIVRSRFDVVVSDQIPWGELIQESYDKDMPIGLNCMNYYGTHKFNELKPMGKETTYYINDALIIHPRDCWDTDLVDTLYKNKELKSAEEGWYQILSEPFGYYHKSYHGGCYLSARWEHVKDVDESLHNQSSK